MLSYGLDQALLEFDHIFSKQWQSGLLPHIRFVEGCEGYSPGPDLWQIPNSEKDRGINTSGITQPPIVGMMMLEVYQQAPSNEKLQVLQRLQPLMTACLDFFNYLLSQRDPLNNHLSCIVHPWESGLDNSPTFDKAIQFSKKTLKQSRFNNRLTGRKDTLNVDAKERPTFNDYEAYGLIMDFLAAHHYDDTNITDRSSFLVQDTLFNACLIKGLQALSLLCKDMLSKLALSEFETQNIRSIIDQSQALYKKCYNSFIKQFYCHDKQAFTCRDLVSNESIGIDSVHTILPLMLDLAPEISKPLIEQATNTELFYSPIGICSTSMQSDNFNPILYWRGPVWPIINWFMVKALLPHDTNKALELAEKSLKTIEEGFDRKAALSLAASLHEFNCINHAFTTPSKNQYQHAWLWDSCFAAIGWQHISQECDTKIWFKVFEHKEHLNNQGCTPTEIRDQLKAKFDIPLFYEYYAPADHRSFETGQPLGSNTMTWTASVYLDLYYLLEEKTQS